MSYREGDIVVYPRHGCCRVIGTENRNNTAYIKLKTISGFNNDLTIMLPVKNMGIIGVRDVISPEKADEIIKLLKSEKGEEKKMNWSKRFKANQEKIYSGDLEKIAEVVRDLSNSNADMANGEKKILSQAKDILYTEIAISKKMNKEEIEKMFVKDEGEETERANGED